MELFITGVILTVSLMLALMLFEVVIGERIGIEDLHDYTELTVPERKKMFAWILSVAIILTTIMVMFVRAVMIDDYYKTIVTMDTQYKTYKEAMKNESLSELDKFELLKQLNDYNNQVLSTRAELRTNIIFTSKELKALVNNLELIGGTE